MLKLSEEEQTMMIKGFADSYIDVAGQGIRKTSLSVASGKIASIGQGEGIHVPADLIVVPGLIDEHIHGSNGCDVMDAKESSLDTIRQSITQDGVTSFCPTTMTMDKAHIFAALKVIHTEILADERDGARILGAHLEGPFISPVFKGAQKAEDIRACDVSLMKEFVQACPEIKEVTFAYEQNGEDLLRYLVSKGITPSIGHSDCPPALLEEGVGKGIRCVTHTYNAQRRFTHRDVGVVGIALLDERLRCELICDLIHVAPDAVRLLYKCKGQDRLILITDSMEGKHLPEGHYALGGQDVIVKEGAARLMDGTLAGSVLTLNKAVKNAKDTLGSLWFRRSNWPARIRPRTSV
jgi:N-acetylglucosamine-6-phosphate deacetylase